MDLPTSENPELSRIGRGPSPKSEPTREADRYMKLAHSPWKLLEMYREEERVRQNIDDLGSGTSARDTAFRTPSYDDYDLDEYQQMVDNASGVGQLIRDQKQAAMVDLFEGAWTTYRGEIPLSWWAEQDPQDINLLIDAPEFAPYDFGFEGIANKVYQIQAAARYSTRREAAMRQEVDERFEEEMNRRSWQGRLTEGLTRFISPGGAVTTVIDAARGLEVAPLANLDESEDELRAKIQESIRQEILNGTPERERGSYAALTNGLMNGVGWIMDKGMNFVDYTIQGLGEDWEALTGHNFYDENAVAFDQAKAEQIEMLRKERETLAPGGYSKPERMFAPDLAEYAYGAADASWMALQEDQPELAEEYRLMAGGDEELAFGFFTSDLTENDSIEEQLQLMWDSEDQEFQAYVQQLEEQDYRAGGAVLDVLGAYGRQVPMRLATAATLLFTDEDMRSAVLDDQWGEFWSEVELNEFSPAQVLGLERTAVGLMLDLGTGIAFDPATWIFGPRGMSMLGRASRASQAKVLAGSTLVQRSLRDMVRLARSSDHGDASLAMLLDWLGDTGHTGDALIALGRRSKVQLGGRGWLHGDARAAQAHEVPITTINEILDPVDVSKVRGVSPKDLDSLESSLRGRGFDSVLELTYDMDRGTLHLTDGVKRLAAANKIGTSAGDDLMVPVTIRMKQTLGKTQRSWSVEGKQTALDDLAAFAERGVSPREITPPHGNVVEFTPDGSTRVLQHTDTPLGEPTTIQIADNGPELSLHQKRGADVGGQTEYMWLDEGGRVRAGFRYDPAAGTGEMWVDQVLQGHRIAERTLDAIADAKNTGGASEVVDMLHSWVRDPSKTQAGAGALRSITKKWLERLNSEAVTTGPRGRPLAELLAEGEKPPRIPQHLEDLTPTVDGKVYVNPKKMFPERLIYGFEDFDELTRIAEEAIAAGGTPPAAHRLATAAGWSDRVRHALQSNQPGRWLDRIITPQSMVTRLDLHGPTAVSKIQEVIFRLWGSNQERATVWTQRLMDIVENKARLELQYADELSRVSTKRLEMEAMDELLGGAWDDAFPESTAFHGTDLDSAAAMAAADEGLEAGGLTRSLDRALEYAEEDGVVLAFADESLPPELAGREIEQFATVDEYVTARALNPDAWEDVPGVLILEGRGPKPQQIRSAAELRQIAANRKQAQRARDQAQRDFLTGLTEVDAKFGKELIGQQMLDDMIREMWDDFNREHIATNPAWSHIELEDGMVPWAELRRGRHQLPETGLTPEGERRLLTEQQVAEGMEMGIADPERLMEQLSNIADIQMGTQLELSPLEMIMASEVGGARYTQMTQTVVGHGVREGAKMAHYAWIIDKVFSISTAARVSLDELARIWSWGGGVHGVGGWALDRAALLSARAAAVLSGTYGPNRALGVTPGISVARGTKALPARVQRRIQGLAEYSNIYKQAERQAFEGMPFNYQDLAPGDAGFADAARRGIGGMLVEDSGFRAALRGRDAFKEWYFSPDGQRMRMAQVTDNGVASLANSWEDAFKGWQTMMQLWFGKSKRFNEVMDALAETSARVDATGGQAPIEIPSWIVNEISSIRGVRKNLPHKRGVTAFTDAYFDKLLMDPVNFRRGEIYQLVKNFETRRLENLFLDQGKQLIPDTELERVLGLQGLGGSTRSGLGPALHQQAFKRGYVTEGYIAELVERRAVTEIENMLYVWDSASRAGRQARPIFPFGKPWTDMMGFWGREVLARPALRGWIGNRQAGNIGEIANHVADLLPFNPKPVAMTSRIANQDFQVDAISASSEELPWMPDIGLPGDAESVDFSPLTFFPTGSSHNPYTQIMPGLGLLPLWAIDRVITELYDPMEDPEGYEQAVQAVSDYIPSVAYQRGGVWGRLFGGGTAAAMVGIGTDIAGYSLGIPFYNVTSELGDIGREINRAREISVMLSDPEEIDALLQLEDPEEIELALSGLALEADQRASAAHIGETAGRKLMPLSFDFDDTVTDIQDVWIDTGLEYGEELGLVDYSLPENATDLEKRQKADDVRRAFFRIPQWERDLLIAEKPEIAVNLISSWDWTPEAISRLGVEALTAYRTDGTRESMARHRLYVDQGYVRPVQPNVRMFRILGLMRAAKENTAKEIYTTTAGRVNDTLWQQGVSEEVKTMLESVLGSTFAKKRGYTSARQLWESWGGLEAELEDAVARERGVTEEMEEWDVIKEKVAIPSKMQAWGTQWPGLDSTSQRFADITVSSFDEKTLRLAESLDIELLPGMTGEEVYEAAAGIVSDADSPLWQMAKLAHDDYIGARTVEGSAWESVLRNQVIFSRQLPTEVRGVANEFLQLASRTETRIFDGDTVPLSEYQAVVDNFQNLRFIAEDLPIDWEGMWAGRFQRTFGPLEWTPPEPPPIIDEDGEQNPNAYRPYIQKIVDGDTVLVSEAQGPTFFGRQLGEGAPPMKSVRLLGVFARELGDEGGLEDRDRLVDFLTEAREQGRDIWIVRDPEQFGTNTDIYGRELAWLIVGDEPFYFPEELDRSISEGGN